MAQFTIGPVQQVSDFLAFTLPSNFQVDQSTDPPTLLYSQSVLAVNSTDLNQAVANGLRQGMIGVSPEQLRGKRLQSIGSGAIVTDRAVTVENALVAAGAPGSESDLVGDILTFSDVDSDADTPQDPAGPDESGDVGSSQVLAYVVLPPMSYFRTLATAGKGIPRIDSFLQFTTTFPAAVERQTYIKNNFGVNGRIVPIAIELAQGADIEVDITLLKQFSSSVGAGGDTGAVIQVDNSLTSPNLYKTAKLESKNIIESAVQNLFFTQGRVESALINNHFDVPTATSGDNSNLIANTEFVQTAIADLVDSAPNTLNTLNELAASLGDDANFATTTATSLGNLRTTITTQADGSFSPYTTTNYINSATSIKDADMKLDTQIKTVADNLAVANSNHQALQTLVGVVPTTSNFLDSNSTFGRQLELLDAQLKTVTDNSSSGGEAATLQDIADVETSINTVEASIGLGTDGSYTSPSAVTGGSHSASDSIYSHTANHDVGNVADYNANIINNLISIDTVVHNLFTAIGTDQKAGELTGVDAGNYTASNVLKTALLNLDSQVKTNTDAISVLSNAGGWNTSSMISSATSTGTSTDYANTYSHPLFVSGRTHGASSAQPIYIRRTSDNQDLGSIGNVLQQDGDSGTYDFYAVVLPPGYSLQSSSPFTVEFAMPLILN